MQQNVQMFSRLTVSLFSSTALFFEKNLSSFNLILYQLYCTTKMLTDSQQIDITPYKVRRETAINSNQQKVFENRPNTDLASSILDKLTEIKDNLYPSHLNIPPQKFGLPQYATINPNTSYQAPSAGQLEPERSSSRFDAYLRNDVLLNSKESRELNSLVKSQGTSPIRKSAGSPHAGNDIQSSQMQDNSNNSSVNHDEAQHTFHENTNTDFKMDLDSSSNNHSIYQTQGIAYLPKYKLDFSIPTNTSLHPFTIGAIEQSHYSPAQDQSLNNTSRAVDNPRGSLPSTCMNSKAQIPESLKSLPSYLQGDIAFESSKNPQLKLALPEIIASGESFRPTPAQSDHRTNKNFNTEFSIPINQLQAYSPTLAATQPLPLTPNSRARLLATIDDALKSGHDSYQASENAVKISSVNRNTDPLSGPSSNLQSLDRFEGRYSHQKTINDKFEADNVTTNTQGMMKRFSFGQLLSDVPTSLENTRSERNEPESVRSIENPIRISHVEIKHNSENVAGAYKDLGSFAQNQIKYKEQENKYGEKSNNRETNEDTGNFAQEKDQKRENILSKINERFKEIIRTPDQQNERLDDNKTMKNFEELIPFNNKRVQNKEDSEINKHFGNLDKDSAFEIDILKKSPVNKINEYPKMTVGSPVQQGEKSEQIFEFVQTRDRGALADFEQTVHQKGTSTATRSYNFLEETNKSPPQQRQHWEGSFKGKPIVQYNFEDSTHNSPNKNAQEDKDSGINQLDFAHKSSVKILPYSPTQQITTDINRDLENRNILRDRNARIENGLANKDTEISKVPEKNFTLDNKCTEEKFGTKPAHENIKEVQDTPNAQEIYFESRGQENIPDTILGESSHIESSIDIDRISKKSGRSKSDYSVSNSPKKFNHAFENGFKHSGQQQRSMLPNLSSQNESASPTQMNVNEKISQDQGQPKFNEKTKDNKESNFVVFSNKKSNNKQSKDDRSLSISPKKDNSEFEDKSNSVQQIKSISYDLSSLRQNERTTNTIKSNIVEKATDIPDKKKPSEKTQDNSRQPNLAVAANKKDIDEQCKNDHSLSNSPRKANSKFDSEFKHPAQQTKDTPHNSNTMKQNQTHLAKTNTTEKTLEVPNRENIHEKTKGSRVQNSVSPNRKLSNEHSGNILAKTI